MYKRLDSARMLTTLERLHGRILKRFPDAGLCNVSAELVETARTTAATAARLAAPNWPLRAAVGAIIVLGAIAQLFAAGFLHIERLQSDIGLLQSLEAAVNLLILFGGAAWFLITLEERFKRQRALDALHQLRSLAHIVDMHQLTKDPSSLIDPIETPNPMSPLELKRYLDFCADLQAHIGKLAALYADRMRDSVVIDAVTEIENLTTGLARKIWQKIAVVTNLDMGASQ